MSAVVCGKRLPFEDLHGSSPITKRQRFVGGNSPLHFPLTWNDLADSGSASCSNFTDCLLHLQSLFPHMDSEILKRALESCDNNLNSAIESLHNLNLDGHGINISSEQSQPLQEVHSSQGSGFASQLPAQPATSSSEHTGEPGCNTTAVEGAEWAEILVREMMSAADLDDARSRVSRALEAFENAVTVRSGRAVDTLQKEVISLKSQLEGVLHDNQILKRAVSIQHERQLEKSGEAVELQQLKQLVSQYQEKVRTLEVNNYALSLHLQKAQEGSPFPGRFHPDVF